MRGEPLFQLVAKVAPLIRGGRFRFNRVFSEEDSHGNEPHAAIVTNADNQSERLYFREDWHAKGRLAVAGMAPDGRRGQWHTCSKGRITVAADRAPAGIAADITRRLLPDYRKSLADAIANQDARTRDAEFLRQAVHLLSLQCAKPLEPWDTWHNLEKWTFDTQMAHGTIERMYDGRWHVDLGRLPFADAVRVLAWLNTQAPAERPPDDD